MAVAVAVSVAVAVAVSVAVAVAVSVVDGVLVGNAPGVLSEMDWIIGLFVVTDDKFRRYCTYRTPVNVVPLGTSLFQAENVVPFIEVL